MRNTIYLFFVGFIFYSGMLSAQYSVTEFNQPNWYTGLFPDKFTAAAICLEGAELSPFESEAKDKLERLKAYFSIIANPTGIHRRRKGAIIRRAQKMLKYADYKGFFFTDDFEYTTRTVSALTYLEYLEEYAADTVQKKMISICWGAEIDSIKFQNLNRVTAKIGYANGNIQKEDSLTALNPPDGFYCVFSGDGHYREDVTFFKDNAIQNLSSCKEIAFKLRYMQIDEEEGEAIYGWEVSVSSITNVSEKKGCKDLPSLEGQCEPPVIPCDSSLIYQRVPFLSYLIPGRGWEYLNPQRKKKKWPIITAVSAGAIGYGIVNKLAISRPAYRKHINATTIKSVDEFYQKANKFHHRFIWSTGGGLLLWALSDALIFRQDNKQNRLFDERFRCDKKGINPGRTIGDEETYQIHEIRPDLINTPEGFLPGLKYSVTF